MVPAASALLALRAPGQPIAAVNLTAAGFCASVQCWSFKEFSLFEAIEFASRTGAEGVELYPGQRLGGPFGDAKFQPGMPDDQIDAVLEHAAKHSIVPVNFGVTDIPKHENEARATFEFAKRLGLYGITTESLDALDTLEKLAREYDLMVCFHNHPQPTALWNPDTVWNAVKDRDPRIGYCADIGHWATSGLNPLEVVKKIAPRIRSFHMKDREKIGGWSHDRPFGTGVIDIVSILDEARKNGFAGNVSVEYEHHWNANQSEIAGCVGYLRGYSKTRA